MRATGYQLVRRSLVSIRLPSVVNAVETVLRFSAKFRRCQSPDGSYAYWIRHEVSQEEVWDCGLVILRPLHAAPMELQNKLQFKYFTSEVLEQWTEVDSVESSNIGDEARNNRERIIHEVFSIFPPTTFVLSADSQAISTQSLLQPFPDNAWVDHDVLEEQATRTGSAAIPGREETIRGPGRPPLLADEVEEWCRVVKLAKGMRKQVPKRTWKHIARDLGVSERTLRYWRHDPRCS